MLLVWFFVPFWIMSIFESFVNFVVVWTLSVLFSIVVSVRIIFLYITRFASMPWSSKDRILMPPPACFADPKYGSHKYVSVNVRNWEWFLEFRYIFNRKMNYLQKVRLHYVESGDNSKPLLLFVHGQFDFWYSWRSQITEFNKDYWSVVWLSDFTWLKKPFMNFCSRRVIAMDLRGFNLSDKPRAASSYKVENLVADLKVFIQRLSML